jgi:hypothetical protein
VVHRSEEREKWTDIGLAVSVIVTPVAYAFEIKHIIWLTHLVILVIIPIRGKQVTQDACAYLFIIFFLGMNMVFIMVMFATNNPQYHILHDILGTLLGLWIFAYLFWINPKHKHVLDTSN